MAEEKKTTENTKADDAGRQVETAESADAAKETNVTGGGSTEGNGSANANSTKSSPYQTLVLIGIGLIIIGIIFVVIALYQPTVSTESSVSFSIINSEDASATTIANNEVVVSESDEYQAHDENEEQETVATATTAAATTAAATQGSASSVTYPLNLNTCTMEELETLSGIGEARASAIISYRNEIGGYTNIEQIKEISGIGDTIFNNIKDYITV